jgi:hypothetical protein
MLNYANAGFHVKLLFGKISFHPNLPLLHCRITILLSINVCRCLIFYDTVPPANRNR